MVGMVAWIHGELHCGESHFDRLHGRPPQHMVVRGQMPPLPVAMDTGTPRLRLCSSCGMASHSKDIVLRHYRNRRKGIFVALTKDFEINLEKIKAVMPGTTYTERFVLMGIEDGSYEIRHPVVGEGHVPPCLPIYHGHVTKDVWLTLALEACNAWLLGSLMSDFDRSKISYNDRKDVLEKVHSISDLRVAVWSFHDKRPHTYVIDDVAASSNVLSYCESKSCMFVDDPEWLECLICGSCNRDREDRRRRQAEGHEPVLELAVTAPALMLAPLPVQGSATIVPAAAPGLLDNVATPLDPLMGMPLDGMGPMQLRGRSLISFVSEGL
ncbi:hypothetical protein ACQ4PT_031027 [Festuca glaucescens]